jgi:hypothetical protein
VVVGIGEGEGLAVVVTTEGEGSGVSAALGVRMGVGAEACITLAGGWVKVGDAEDAGAPLLFGENEHPTATNAAIINTEAIPRTHRLVSLESFGLVFSLLPNNSTTGAYSNYFRSF